MLKARADAVAGGGGGHHDIVRTGVMYIAMENAISENGVLSIFIGHHD